LQSPSWTPRAPRPRAATHLRTRPDGSRFDIGAVVGGAAVNQLARAVSAGAGDGTGLFDITSLNAETEAAASIKAIIRPSSALQYVPTVPAGWPTSGGVQAYLPSLRISPQLKDNGVFQPIADAGTLAADVYVGANVGVDSQTNQITFDPDVHVEPRFLRLTGTNATLDHDPQGRTPQVIEVVADQIRLQVPPRVNALLQGIEVPNLSKLLVTNGLPDMVLTHLSMGTVGGRNLGVYADVDPNPTHVAVDVTWDDQMNATLHVATTGFPSYGPQTIDWQILDGATGQPVYQSPPEGDKDKTSITIPNAALHEFVYDPCQGLRWIRVTATATVTQAGVTGQGTGEGSQYYMGAPDWDPNRCGGQP
jgi:hypothetical protein